MDTQYFTEETLDQAAQVLKEGGLVAFPTETVYGLGAIATDSAAVQAVFEAKGRPSDNPLIVHVASLDQVSPWVEEVPVMAKLLAKAFWPGPLTMILKAKPGLLAPEVSAGLDTVSFRMPDHPLTLALIDKVGLPLVGPSANRSTRPSPTRAKDVMDDLEGRIDGVLEGGQTQLGVESTVLDLTNDLGPMILRPGVLTEAEIEAVIGPLVHFVPDKEGQLSKPKAPGMKYRHYAPSTELIALLGDLDFWQDQVDQALMAGKRIGVLAQEEICQALASQVTQVLSYGPGLNLAAMNHGLFAGLRDLDQGQVDVIFVQASPQTGLGLAYMNRLTKAASQVFIQEV